MLPGACLRVFRRFVIWHRHLVLASYYSNCNEQECGHKCSAGAALASASVRVGERACARVHACVRACVHLCVRVCVVCSPWPVIATADALPTHDSPTVDAHVTPVLSVGVCGCRC
jgi:hypothetical protein